MSRIINLEVNEKGSWKRVAGFDIDTFEDGDLEHCAASLFELSSNENLKLRVIMPGDTAPLMTWSKVNGWREWRAA